MTKLRILVLYFSYFTDNSNMIWEKEMVAKVINKTVGLYWGLGVPNFKVYLAKMSLPHILLFPHSFNYFGYVLKIYRRMEEAFQLLFGS